MDAYIYQAALLCSECGMAKRNQLTAGAIVDNEDSDSFPQGPYSDGGGEADTPQHCDTCGVFLENPLTPDGMGYVNQARDSAVSELWREFYGIPETA